MNLKHWELDPTGSNPDNLIEMELHPYEPTDEFSQLITPLYGPFFSAQVYDELGNLIDEDEWVYGDETPPLNSLVEKPLYHSVIFKKELKRTVKISYQTVGSELVRPRTEVAEYLVNVLNSPIKTQWSSVREVPHMYPVNEHSQHWIDVQNTTPLGKAIESIGDSYLEHLEDVSQGDVASIKNKLVLLSETLNQYRLEEHMTNPLAHSNQAQEYYAEVKDSVARNADRVYGFAYLKLCLDTQASGLNWSRVTKYLKRYNSTRLEDDLLVMANFTWGDKVFDEKLKAKTFARLGGRNFASVGHTLYPLVAAPYGVSIGMHKFFDLSGAIEYSKGLDGIKMISIRSTDFTFNGNGSALSPLSLDINYRLASATEKGFARLTKTIDEKSEGYGLTSKTLEDLIKTYVNYLPNTVKVNGIVATGDVVLTKESIGLGEVQDTPDLDKEISIAQQNALDGLSDANHRHDFDDVEWETATDNNYGIDVLSSDLEVAGAVSHELGEHHIDLFEMLLLDYSDKVEDENIRLVATKSISSVCTEHNITLTGGELYVIEFGDKTITALPTQTVEYPIETHGLDRDLLLYYRATDNTYLISKVPIKDTSVVLAGKVNPFRSKDGVLESVVDYGTDQLLVEHEKDERPHGLDYKNIDLDKLVNLDLFRSSPVAEAIVFDGNKIRTSNVLDFSRVDCSGLAIKSRGGNPLAWRAGELKGIRYQSSFVADAELTELLNIAATPLDIILGYIKDKSTVRLLSLAFTPDNIVKLYIENWSYEASEGGITLTNASRNELELDIKNHHTLVNSGGDLGLFKWSYSTSDHSFAVEVLSGKHEVITGHVLALDDSIKKQLSDLLDNPYVGLRMSAGNKLAVAGCVRSPNPQNPVYINDYTSLFNSYVSTETMKHHRKSLGKYKTRVTLPGYYREADNRLVLGNIDNALPHGYNIFDFTMLSLKDNDGTTPLVRLDQKDLQDKLSMGAIVNCDNWRDGYSANFKRKVNQTIAFEPLPIIDGKLLGEYPVDGTPLILTGEIMCTNTLWGISAYDWNSLASHLTGYEEPLPPVLVEELLSGFESILIEV